MSGSFIPVIKTVVAECGTVVLRNGSSVQTSVSAAMTDDSFYDISKAKLVYLSNNPEVATVDEKGLVTAKGVGVATITACVTIGEYTESGSYPVKIMPNLSPASITVNNKNIPGFNPGLSGYSYLLKDASSQAPVVNITPADPAVGVETIQAKGIPGTAIITLTDYISVDKRELSINFGIKSVSEEFNNQVLGNHWNWVRENKENWSLSKSKGSLVIKGVKGDIAGASNNAENILLQSANTDWTILSKVTFSRKPSEINQQGGIIALQDDDNFVKVVYRANPRFGRGGGGSGSGVVDMIVEKNGNYSSFASPRSGDALTANNSSLIMKLERKGSIVTGSYSIEGKSFTKIGTVELVLSEAKAGMIVCNGSDTGRPDMQRMQGMPAQAQATVQTDFEVAFDYFRITNSGLK